MAERRLLRQVMSPSDIYAHAESICDMLREQYGSYDADSLEEVFVDESCAQRLKARGYDLLGEGGEPVEAVPLPPRRDVPRMDVGPSASMRRPGGDRSLPVRRGTNDGAVPMRRRDGPSDSSVPIRRSERTSSDGGVPRRRDTASPGDGMGPMRRRDGASQNDGVPMRRRDNRPAGDMIPTPPSLDPPSNVSAPSPRRSWDSAREEASQTPSRRENTPPATPPASTSAFGDARALERSDGSSGDSGRDENQRTAPGGSVRPTGPAVTTPVQATVSTQDMSPPVVEAPAQPSQSVAQTGAADRPVTEAPMIEAPATKPTPRTRRTTRSRAKADPDTSAG